jgi:hypothetical protein
MANERAASSVDVEAHLAGYPLLDAFLERRSRRFAPGIAHTSGRFSQKKFACQGIRLGGVRVS